MSVAKEQLQLDFEVPSAAAAPPHAHSPHAKVRALWRQLVRLLRLIGLVAATVALGWCSSLLEQVERGSAPLNHLLAPAFVAIGLGVVVVVMLAVALVRPARAPSGADDEPPGAEKMHEKAAMTGQPYSPHVHSGGGGGGGSGGAVW